jgi:HD-GYP domain-containing protein (c-di-GMP phosphodiesterase class II)
MPSRVSNSADVDPDQLASRFARRPWMTRAVLTLAEELRAHHAATADHSHRLADLARVVAQRMELDAFAAIEAELVAVLHDVGKLAVDPALLDQHTPLTDEQIRRVRRHTIEGEELLAGIAGLEELAPAVRATHEAWDGTGYPDGLRGDRIPLAARIVAVVDAYDAMTSHRAYRRAVPPREACRRLRASAGLQFDPHVVEAFLPGP